MNTAPLYICKKGGKYFIRKENGCMDEKLFSENEVVGCEGKFVSYRRGFIDGVPTSGWRPLRDGEVPEKGYWYQLNVGYYDYYVYIDAKAFETQFRPVERKHKEVKEFKNEKELNEWLKDKDPSTVEKIEGVKRKYAVVFISDGDEKYIRDFS